MQAAFLSRFVSRLETFDCHHESSCNYPPDRLCHLCDVPEGPSASLLQLVWTCIKDPTTASAFTEIFPQAMESSSSGGGDEGSSTSLGSATETRAAGGNSASSPCDTGIQVGTLRGDKYNLRKSSLRIRVEVERKQQQPRQKKPKSRPPPLSKYRRRSANARERCRMKEMNEAYEELKKVLPHLALGTCESSTWDSGTSSSSRQTDSSNNKPTKVAVLRVAINYIAALRGLLGYDDNNSNPSHNLCSDDLGSDAASTSAASTTGTSGDEESLLSSDMDATVSDLTEYYAVANFLSPDLTPDLLEPDLTLTLSPEEELCLELVADVL